MASPKKTLVLSSESAGDWAKLGHLYFEKCELDLAQEAFEKALSLAQAQKDPKEIAAALVGLLRFASERMDGELHDRWVIELDALAAQFPTKIPPSVWYHKGVSAARSRHYRIAQRFFHKSLNESRREKGCSEEEREANIARALVGLANISHWRGLARRADALAQILERHVVPKNIRGINGVVFMLLGECRERRTDLTGALEWFRKAHGVFLEERNWYFHLYVLLAYARLARLQQHYTQAYFYLDLIEKPWRERPSARLSARWFRKRGDFKMQRSIS